MALSLWQLHIIIIELGNGLQKSGRRGIIKMHGKEGFKQVLEETDGVLAFSKTNFCLEQGKVELKLANGYAELPIGCSCRIIWN